MIKDLPLNVVKDIFIAVVLENETPEQKQWTVYLINKRDTALKNVFITSKGYGLKNGKENKTSTLRHFFEEIPAGTIQKIEAIDPEVFGLTNEYWLSYYLENTIYDKKYIFLPESIVDENLVKIPLSHKVGILIGGDIG